MKRPKTDQDTVRELQDALKVAEQRLAEMKQERDDANDLVERMNQHLDDCAAMIEQWKQAFEMELSDDGTWQFDGDSVIERYEAMVGQHVELRKKWNRAVADFNAVYADRAPPGRPLAATETQCAEVRRLRQKELSLREIADDTSLGLRTVRTILGRDTRSDRTTIKRLERVDPMRDEVIRAKARKRSRNALPGKITQALAGIDDLKKAAKGLGK